MGKLAAFLMSAYLVSQGFDSAIRWALGLIGLAPLIYLRDAGLVLVVALSISAVMMNNGNLTRIFWLLWVIGFGAVVAFFSGLPSLQILFGLKVMLPIVAGFSMTEAGTAPLLNRPKLWAAVWFVVALGVIFNYFYQYPWIGLTLSVGDAEVVANREWSAEGVRRLSGFCRTSFDAAILILLLYVYLMMTVKTKLSKFLLVLISLAATVLTTTKGVVAVLAATLIMLPLIHRKEPIRGAQWLASVTIYTVACVGLILPLVALEIPFPNFRRGTVAKWLLSSLMDRAWRTWPYAFSTLTDWQYVTGRGVGGIGTPQQLFEKTLNWSPADNLFVYLYVTAGLAGAFIFIFCSLSTSCLQLQKRTDQMAFMFLFCIFSYGIISNVIENSPVAIVFGALISFCSMRFAHRFFRFEPRHLHTAN